MEHEVSSLVESLALRSLFVGLNDGQITALVSAGRIERFESGETILSEGEPGQALYTVLSGSITIRTTCTDTGTQAELAVLRGGETLSAQYEGDFFGEMSVLDFEPISATVTACEPCELLIVPVQALYEVFQNDRDIQLILISNIARTLSRRLRLANRHREVPQTADSS
jgi:CRP-like cAMP-binding protein